MRTNKYKSSTLLGCFTAMIISTVSGSDKDSKKAPLNPNLGLQAMASSLIPLRCSYHSDPRVSVHEVYVQTGYTELVIYQWGTWWDDEFAFVYNCSFDKSTNSFKINNRSVPRADKAKIKAMTAAMHAMVAQDKKDDLAKKQKPTAGLASYVFERPPGGKEKQLARMWSGDLSSKKIKLGQLYHKFQKLFHGTEKPKPER